MIRVYQIFIINLILLFSTQNIYSINLGIQGTVWVIVEEGFLTMIKNRLSKIDLLGKQNELQKKISTNATNPRSLNLPITKVERSFIVDPTYIVLNDIILPNGEILYKAGYKVNPLDYTPINNMLIFLDGTNLESLNWVIKNKKNLIINNMEADIILTAGSPLKISKDLNHQNIYFDQFGELTKKLSIKNVPALVIQDGNVLKIIEVKL